MRGTQIKSNFAPKVRKIFAPWRVEIHVRASYPVIRSHCRHSQTTQEGEILAVKISNEQERIRYLKIDGLRYNNREDFSEIVSTPHVQVCMECTLPVEEL